MLVLSRLLSFATWLDFALTLALLMTIGARAATHDRFVSSIAYRWAIEVGLLSSCAYWVLAFCYYFHSRFGVGMGEMWTLSIIGVLPAAVLGGVSGLLGGIELPIPWKAVSIAIAAPNVFAVVTVGWWMIRARLFR